uniref:Uncharacterized protein n=1 Tax=Rhipicephalus zambeziensis TaxID=60191 RepID=A0A224YJE6_9ACAR
MSEARPSITSATVSFGGVTGRPTNDVSLECAPIGAGSYSSAYQERDRETTLSHLKRKGLRERRRVLLAVDHLKTDSKCSVVAAHGSLPQLLTT